jgi:hypothetical protein
MHVDNIAAKQRKIIAFRGIELTANKHQAAGLAF